MRKTLLIICILALFAGVWAADFRLQVNNKATYWREMSTGNKFFENYTNAVSSWKQYQLGLEYEALLPERSLDGNYQADNTDNRLRKLYLEYRQDDAYVRVGNFYEVFGSGAVLNLKEDRDADIEHDLMGVIAGIQKEIPFWQEPIQTETRFFYGQSPRETGHVSSNTLLGMDNRNRLRGAQSQWQWQMLQWGGGLLDADIHTSNATKFREEQIYFVNGEIELPFAAISGEYAERNMEREIGNATQKAYGRGLLLSLQTQAGPIFVTGNYKDVDNLAWDDGNSKLYSDVASFNYSDDPITPNMASGQDDQGGQLLLETSLLGLDFLLDNAYLTTESGDEIYQEHALRIASYQDFTWETTFDYVSNEYFYIPVIDTTTITATKISNETSLNWNIWNTPVFGGWKVTYHDMFKTEEVDNYEYKFYAGLVPLPQLDISAKYERTEKTHPYDHDAKGNAKNNWLSYLVKWQVNDTHHIELFYGAERGGKDCSSGTCIEKTPFQGFRMQVSSRF